MSNVVAITTFSNPDLLAIALNFFSQDKIIDNFKIRLFTEDGFDKEIEKVIENFSFLDIDLTVRRRYPSCPLTGFHNILETYRDAAQMTDEYVCVFEDDIIGIKGVLSYYDKVHQKFLSKYDRIFALGNKIRRDNEKKGNANILIGDNQLPSPACITKKVIENYILPHLVPELYNDPCKYYSTHFPNFRVPPWVLMHHDTGLERILDSNKMWGIKPDAAFTGHVGLRGIHSKGQAPKGNLQERIEQYLELMQDGDKLRSLSTTPEDLVVANWEGEKWDNLEIDVDRNKATGSSWHYDPNNEFRSYILSA